MTMRFGQLVEVEYLVGGDRLLDARAVRHLRPRAGCDQDLVGRDLVPPASSTSLGPVTVARSWKIVDVVVVSVSV